MPYAFRDIYNNYDSDLRINKDKLVQGDQVKVINFIKFRTIQNRRTPIIGICGDVLKSRIFKYYHGSPIRLGANR